MSIKKVSCLAGSIYGILPKNIAKIISLYSIRKITDPGAEIRLNLGCGPVKIPGFIGLDLSPCADVVWNISWGIPFKDNSVIEIRADHFLEHLELPLVDMTLRECRRVLVAGGILNIAVPHIDPYLKAYLMDDFDFIKAKISDIPEDQVHLYTTCFDRISWLLYRSGEHKSCFDKRSITRKVKAAGFRQVTVREYDERLHFVRRFSSIYVAAKK